MSNTFRGSSSRAWSNAEDKLSDWPFPARPHETQGVEEREKGRKRGRGKREEERQRKKETGRGTKRGRERERENRKRYAWESIQPLPKRTALHK